MTYLDDHVRGDTFRYEFELGNGWTGTDFTGGLLFTLRTRAGSSTEEDDESAVDQASADDAEITMNGTLGVIIIPASRTKAWPAKNLKWDLQGKVTATPEDLVYTIDLGDIRILPDITRTQ